MYGFAQFVSNYRGHSITHHNGAHPGQYSIVLMDREAGFTISLMLNWKDWSDGGAGWRVCWMMTKVLMDDLRGLDPLIDIEDDDFKVDDIAGGHVGLLRASAEDTESKLYSYDLQTVTGKYHHSGYHTLRLIPASSENVEHCALIDALNTTAPTWIASVNTYLTSHLLFTHVVGNEFSWIATRLFPGDVVNVEGRGAALILPGGIGMFVGWWGEELSRSAVGVEDSDVETMAEIWFSRVKEAVH